MDDRALPHQALVRHLEWDAAATQQAGQDRTDASESNENLRDSVSEGHIAAAAHPRCRAGQSDGERHEIRDEGCEIDPHDEDARGPIEQGDRELRQVERDQDTPEGKMVEQIEPVPPRNRTPRKKSPCAEEDLDGAETP